MLVTKLSCVSLLVGFPVVWLVSHDFLKRLGRHTFMLSFNKRFSAIPNQSKPKSMHVSFKYVCMYV